MMKFTEAETEKFYDTEDSFYRSFWDKKGSLHWGYFDNKESGDFLSACVRWDDFMLQRSNISSNSRVLDIGCGNGNTSFWLAEKTQCTVLGIDLSGVRIDHAQQRAQSLPSLNVSFKKASVTNLPFADKEFTHVWSQATLYHVHDRAKALEEISRVLAEGGQFIFDDLVSPKTTIGPMAQKYVYDRLLFSPSFSHKSYQNILNNNQLMVLESKNLSKHLDQSYCCLQQMAQESYPDLSKSYSKMREAIDIDELGWSFYLCQKVSDRLSWIYETEDKQSLIAKYNAWADVYDSDLNSTYRKSPINAAKNLNRAVPITSASILDFGAGTGMVGEALAQYGYSDITGVDISAKMIEVAKKKGVYSELLLEDIDSPFCQKNRKKYDAILATGVFTYGHADPRYIRDLFDTLKVGGFFVLTIREDYYESTSLLRQILDELAWKLTWRDKFKIFETESMMTLVFNKNSVKRES